MFGDFDGKATRDGDRGRRSVSLVLAGLIFVGLVAAVGTSIATTHAIERREHDVRVEFAPVPSSAPEPPPPPPAPPPPRPPERRPRRARPTAVADAPPRSIPSEHAAEAEGELPEPDESGPPGSEDGVEGGTDPAPRVEPPPPPPPEPAPEPPRPPPRPPEQERIEIAPPRMLGGCAVPERPEALEGATAETITIYVRVVVGTDGRVLRASLERSHALIPDETILSCVRTRIYQPARLPDGTPVPYPLRYAFTFRPDVL
ncbi:MAG TPA: hypothetical protein VIL20_11635 [Sandaracinaceae bacterium]